MPRQAMPSVTKPTTSTKGGKLQQFKGGTGLNVRSSPRAASISPDVKIEEKTTYDVLLRLLNVWNGTPDQAVTLSQLRYLNGAFIIDNRRNDVLMEILGMLRYQTFDDVLLFITDAPNAAFILWEQSSLDEGRAKVAREIAIQQAEELGIKGVGKCRYCQSTELVFALKQTRSADEGFTIFVRCVSCMKQWRQ
jgi:hypothetical protein